MRGEIIIYCGLFRERKWSESSTKTWLFGSKDHQRFNLTGNFLSIRLCHRHRHTDINAAAAGSCETLACRCYAIINYVDVLDSGGQRLYIIYIVYYMLCKCSYIILLIMSYILIYSHYTLSWVAIQIPIFVTGPDNNSLTIETDAATAARFTLGRGRALIILSKRVMKWHHLPATE